MSVTVILCPFEKFNTVKIIRRGSMLKRGTLVISIFFICFFTVFSEEIKWSHSLDEGARLLRKEKKPMMVDVYADWCGWCTKLDQTTYIDPEVVKLSKNFINVKVDSEKNIEEYEFLRDNFKVEGFPTILFFDQNGRYIDSIGGYVEAETLAKCLSYIDSEIKKTSQKTASSNQAQIEWIYSLDEALSKSKAEGKTIMIDVFADWCGWCTKLDEDTYSSPEVVELSKNFINLKIDSDNNLKDYKILREKFNITGFPAILFIDGEYNLVHRIGGYVGADRFINEVKKMNSKTAVNFARDFATACDNAKKARENGIKKEIVVFTSIGDNEVFDKLFANKDFAKSMKDNCEVVFVDNEEKLSELEKKINYEVYDNSVIILNSKLSMVSKYSGAEDSRKLQEKIEKMVALSWE